MGLFDKKNESSNVMRLTEVEKSLSIQAQKLGISTTELIELGKGKSCPKYGTTEILHARRVRGGKIVVFNISEKYRGEKISEGRKQTKATNAAVNKVISENNKK